MRIVFFIISFIIIIFGITFAYLNADIVVFNYYLGESSMPLSLLLVCALAVGIIIGVLTMILTWIGLKTENLCLKKQLKNSQQEIENLRAIPIKEKI